MDFIDKMVGIRPNTKKTYKSLYKNHIYGRIRIQGARDELAVFTQAINWVNRDGLSPRTVKTLVYLMVAEIQDVHGVKVNPKNIIRQLSACQSLKDPILKALTKAEADLILKHTKDRLYLPILLAYHAGARRGEVFGLRWKDCHFTNGLITIRRSYDGPTKSGRPREVPMSGFLQKQLYIRFKKADNCLEGTVIDKQFNPNPLINTVCRRLNIRPVTIHTFRHTFATLALEAGRSPREVQEVLGHANVTTTLNMYWGLTNNNKLNMGFLDETG